MNELFTTYRVRQVRDLTEGRGGMATKAYFLTEDGAFKYLQSIDGIMGTDAGKEIIKAVYVQEDPNNSELTIIRVPVWGPRTRPDGVTDIGWLDLRDCPDPSKNAEYAEYLRLKAIYE